MLTVSSIWRLQGFAGTGHLAGSYFPEPLVCQDGDGAHDRNPDRSCRGGHSFVGEEAPTSARWNSNMGTSSPKDLRAYGTNPGRNADQPYIVKVEMVPPLTWTQLGQRLSESYIFDKTCLRSRCAAGTVSRFQPRRIADHPYPYDEVPKDCAFWKHDQPGQPGCWNRPSGNYFATAPRTSDVIAFLSTWERQIIGPAYRKGLTNTTYMAFVR